MKHFVITVFAITMFALSSIHVVADEFEIDEEVEGLDGRTIIRKTPDVGGKAGPTGGVIENYNGPIPSGSVSDEYLKHTPGCGVNAAGYKGGVYVDVDGKPYFLRCSN